VRRANQRRERFLDGAARRCTQEFVGIERKHPRGFRRREQVTDQPVLHQLLIERRTRVLRNEDRQALGLQFAQYVRRFVDRHVIDDRNAVEQGEIVPNECLDDVRLVADVRGSQQPHVGGFDLAPVQQHADQESGDGGCADRRPRIVVHVVVGDARRRARAIHRLAFELLQPQFRGQQLRFHLRSKVLRALAGLVARAFQQVFGFAQHRGKIIEQRLAGQVHRRLLR
jgi:hypothetical protein